MKDINLEIPKKVIDLIEGSGNDFHSKVARWFSENGWEIIISPYYMDQALNKAREIDLIVEKPFSFFENDGLRGPYLVVRLFVECKFIANYTAFWFSDKDRNAAKELVRRSIPFNGDNTYTNDHHYLKNSSTVAKLFSTVKKERNDGRLRAQENDPFYVALNQVLNAMTSMRSHPITEHVKRARQGSPQKTLSFPIVVCSSFKDLYAVDFYQDSSPRVLKENFQLEVRYAYVDKHQKHQNDYFLIDIVEFGSP